VCLFASLPKPRHRAPCIREFARHGALESGSFDEAEY
jgi:hypothetical protein